MSVIQDWTKYMDWEQNYEEFPDCKYMNSIF